MKKSVSVILSVLLLMTCCSVPAEEKADEDRIVLTIGDMQTRSGSRYNENYGLWQYLADQLNVEIKYIYMTPEEYAAGLATGDLPDIVSTDKNLAMIMESGVALDADPYLEEYCPNLLQGEMRGVQKA